MVGDRYFTTEYEKREEEDVNVKRDIDNKAGRERGFIKIYNGI